LEEGKERRRMGRCRRKNDPEGLWLITEKTHKDFTINKVKSITKMSARASYQQMLQEAHKTKLSILTMC
jgi:hypothetical protein